MEREFPHFNIKEVTETAIWRVLRRGKVKVFFMPLKYLAGFYVPRGKTRDKRNPEIYINSNLPTLGQRKSLMHECTHFLCHQGSKSLYMRMGFDGNESDDYRADKFEKEARAMTAVAFLPRLEFFRISEQKPEEISLLARSIYEDRLEYWENYEQYNLDYQRRLAA